MNKLGDGRALSATHLADGARVTRQAITKHLHVLEDAGLVSRLKEGREVLYMCWKRAVSKTPARSSTASRPDGTALSRLRRHVEDE